MTSARRLAAAATAAAIVACLLLTGFAGARGSRSAAGLSVSVVRSVSKPKANRRKSSSARRAECAAAARTKKARKACAIGKGKARAKKPSASPMPPSSPPSVATTGAPAPAIADLLPADAFAVPISESASPAESTGGSNTPPVELPAEPDRPVELKAPLEESLPPVEESKPSVEEQKPPVEEPKPPVEEPESPIEAPLAGKVSTTTTLVSSRSPSSVGEAIIYTATVNAIAATGSITFKDAGTVIAGCADQTVSFGSTTCTIIGDVASTKPITATYNGDGDYAGSTSSPVNQVVSRGSTSTTLTSSANPSVVWQSVTYTATVSPATATGTVAFDEAGTPIAGCTAQPVGSGTATCTHAGYTTAGTDSIAATYSGDGNHLQSASSSFKQVVDKMGTTQTTTAVSSSSDPSIVGDGVTYTAAVGPATATGTVAFEEAGTPIAGCAGRPVSSGTATCTVGGLSAGGHWVKAVYSGDSNYATSTSSGLTQTVNKKATTMAVSSSLNPSIAGEGVTYTATLNTAAATGAVKFEDGGIAISGCNAQAVSKGSATCTVANLTAGSHWVKAVYSGDSNYATSTSSGLTQTVNKKATAMAVSSSLNPSIAGEGVTYTATLNTAAATGAVKFEDGGIAISGCNAQAVSKGSATCTVANLTAGSHWVKAVYSGDSNYATSTSSGLTQTVNKKATATVLSSSLDPSPVGESVTYTAKVGPVVATGTVAFEEAGAPIAGCAGRPVSSGTATCRVAGLSVGGHWVKAVYSGDSNYATSTSSGLTQTVNKKATTMTVSSSLNPSIAGDGVTYTATLNTAAVTGTVAFEDGSIAIPGCNAQAINNGSATCTVPSYPAWSSYFITAAYSGDTNHLASVSPVLIQTVEPPPVAPGGPFRFFSTSSFWNEEVPANSELDPNSSSIVKAFNEQVSSEQETEGGPSIATTDYSVPLYTVPAGQPTVTVKLNHTHPPPALQSAWDAVPLPSYAQSAAGTDKHLVVWQPSTDRLWEFWRLEDTAYGWQAEWGGAMQNVSSNPGVYGPEAWSGAEASWGGDASSLSLAGGLITLEDLEDGQINHALALAVPNVRAGAYASPAKRTDGYSTSPLSLPEGAHLRLEPGLNLAALHLPRFTLMLAEAAQRYGIFIRSRAPAGGIVNFYGQDPTPTGTDPYTGPHGYFEGKSSVQAIADFPWSHLQLLKMELHSTS